MSGNVADRYFTNWCHATSTKDERRCWHATDTEPGRSQVHSQVPLVYCLLVVSELLKSAPSSVDH